MALAVVMSAWPGCGVGTHPYRARTVLVPARRPRLVGERLWRGGRTQAASEGMLPMMTVGASSIVCVRVEPTVNAFRVGNLP